MNEKSHHRLRLISWNINSIGRRYDELKELAQTYTPDIICLQKVRCNSTREKYMLNGYAALYNTNDYGDWSGVSMFVKLNHPELPAVMQLDTFPQRLHTIELSANGHLQVFRFEKFFLVNAYVPYANTQIEGAVEYRKEWYPKFRGLIFNLRKELPVVICGDLNIVHTEKDTCEARLVQEKRPCFTTWERNAFIALLSQSDLVDTFRELHPDDNRPTFYGNFRKLGIGNRIDYFLISRELLPNLTNADILNDFGTGQSAPILIDLNL